MTPIPKAAQVIARVIRAKVKRPKRLPIYNIISYRRLDGVLRFNRKKGTCCPMGLLPEAQRLPTFIEHFKTPPGTNDEIYSFWAWWDFQTNPQQAVDAVWGKNRKFLNE